MAAYGALVSLMHIIDSIEKHPSPPISIHQTQIQSLTENVTSLQDFLDGYISPFANSHEADPLERRIADAANAAEDVIESQILVQIDRRSTIVEDHGFDQDLRKVIEEMDLILKEVKKIAQLQQKPVAALTSSSDMKNNMMVGFDQVFLEVLDKLTRGQLSRQIIPIMGMGGIGKTTLAINLFENALVKEYFDIRAWTTISQTYNIRETLREVLIQASGELNDLSDLSDLSVNDLGEKLHKCLSGRRYLIIMDDMWSIDVWDKMRFFFPDSKNGSRIIVTTRLSNLTSQLNEPYGVDMKFLDEASSWGLFYKRVFQKENCPLELESIGKNIVASCKGLPLSIATIGGLLAKSERTSENWKRIEQNLNSIVINSNDEFCLNILRMSYIYLPNYLKPCFLYMGVFEEDLSIRVSMLKKLWISEGFLKPRSGKCLETIAQLYFKELVDRNLILVDKLGSTGNIKYCKIHDLLRDLCLKEGEKERFYLVIRGDSPCTKSERRIVFPVKTTQGLLINKAFVSMSHTRSIICCQNYAEVRLSHNVRLLRTFKTYDIDTYMRRYSVSRVGTYCLDNVFELVNSRYLAIRVHEESKFPSSVDLLWNLQTLIIHCHHDLVAPIEIWKLHQLRHLEFMGVGLSPPDPPSGDNDIVIMEHLHTLRGAKNLYLSEEVVKRIRDVKKLHLLYDVKQVEKANWLSYLQCLSTLENFHCSTFDECDEYWRWIVFPHSLKKLYLNNSCNLELEYILPKIGSLPLLEKFVLIRGFFKTGKWETTDGQFPSLKFLQLWMCSGLEDWIVSDKSHFPVLRGLRLSFLDELKEIPSEVGDIATLKSIYMEYCSEAAVVSAKTIVEEQEDLYGGELELHVRALVRKEEVEALKSLASTNFEVIESTL